MLTLQEVKQALPPHLRTTVTQELTDKVNSISVDPEAADNIRQNFVSYSMVLKEGKFKLEDYLNAVAYVSYKLMGHTNKDSYVKTFPKRYRDHVANGASEKDISAYISIFNKGKLVNLILEQSIIPTWILNQDAVQKAINVQVELMHTSNSDKVRCEAANSILNHLKRPEKKQVELSVGIADNSGMDELNETLKQLALQQQSMIESGISTQEIAHQKIIQKQDVLDAEVISDEQY